MPLYALGDRTPSIHPDAFIHPDAVIIGDVRRRRGVLGVAERGPAR